MRSQMHDSIASRQGGLEVLIQRPVDPSWLPSQGQARPATRAALRNDFVTCSHRLFEEMGADEAGTPSDEKPHG